MIAKEHSFEYVFKTLFERFMGETLYTSFPAEIVSFDGKKAEIKPLFERVYSSGEILKAENIPNVPIVQYQTKECIVKLPICKGDTGLAICTKPNINNWLNGNNTAQHDINTQFNLNNVVFIVGLKTFKTDVISDNTEDFELIYKDTKFTIKKNGDAIIENKNGNITLFDNGKVNINNGNLEVLK